MEVVNTLINGDFDLIKNSQYLLLILTVVLFLESAFVFLPLPGDSLVIFAGGMIALGVLPLSETVMHLSAAASIGGFLAYWQGRMLNRSHCHKKIVTILPANSMERASQLLTKYGFLSLFVSRFIPFVRVLTPMMMGLGRLNPLKVFISNLTSSLLWISALLVLGKVLILNPVLESYQATLLKGLVGFSLVLMIIAMIGIVTRFFKYKSNPQSEYEKFN
ncbi:DedA family protein [Shewanella waksmanii]|uniref:DedA family protein n=1 Tax=Shewanella waksmanii TaxID=213783 RepID=UPI00048F553E|nr:DedA family protein [Shewanella waksmanii]